MVSNSPNALPRGTHSFQDIWWMHHDNVGYVFSQKGLPHVFIHNDIQTGSWSDVGSVGPNGTLSKDVFKSWINHPNPSNGSYQYVVVPAIDFALFQQKLPSYANQIIVLENSATAQAVFHTELNSMGVIFWSAGKVNGPTPEWTLSADKPCVVLLVTVQNTIVFSVSNPQQDLENNDVAITLSQSLSGIGCESDESTTTVRFKLGTGDFAGRTSSHFCVARMDSL